MNKQLYLGDVPQEVRPDEQDREIVGMGGPQVAMMAKRSKRRNATVFINSGHVVSLESRQVLTNNGNRNYLLIQNKSAGKIYVSFGTKANPLDGVEISAGGNYEPYVVPSSSVEVLATVAASKVTVVEGF